MERGSFARCLWSESEDARGDRSGIRDNNPGRLPGVSRRFVLHQTIKGRPNRQQSSLQISYLFDFEQHNVSTVSRACIF